MTAPGSDDRFLTLWLPGSNPGTRELRATIKGLNSSFNRDLVRTILLTGEPGVGKNYVARVIAAHRRWLDSGSDDEDPAGTPAAGLLPEISLPSLPDALAEAELFGARRGAYTGADHDRPGLLHSTEPDILLDEIGDASPALQTKLLAVIQLRRFRQLGAPLEEEEETDARFLLSTHRDLSALVREGLFREDLWWRCVEFEIRIPALREQPENIVTIADRILLDLEPKAFYSRTEPSSSLRERPVLSDEERSWAVRYSWPGNVRELEQVLKRWLFHGGRRSLATLVRAADLRPGPDLAGPEESLDAALDAGTAVASNLGALLSKLSREHRNAIVRWSERKQPRDHELSTLFPEMTPKSFKAKIRQWRSQ